jgi:hypothetical protein
MCLADQRNLLATEAYQRRLNKFVNEEAVGERERTPFVSIKQIVESRRWKH